jgi:cytidylate kinase
MASNRRREFVAPLQVVVTAEVRERIKKIATRENLSMAAVIRELIEGSQSLVEREKTSRRRGRKTTV